MKSSRPTAPAPLPPLQTLHLYGLAAGQSLPLVSKEPPAGLRLQTAPAIGPVADLLFPEPARAARRDAFYSETCTAVAHGLARVWALETPEGALVSTVGAYAMAGRRSLHGLRGDDSRAPAVRALAAG